MEIDANVMTFLMHAAVPGIYHQMWAPSTAIDQPVSPIAKETTSYQSTTNANPTVSRPPKGTSIRKISDSPALTGGVDAFHRPVQQQSVTLEEELSVSNKGGEPRGFY